jgi:hypothetical protein
MMISKNLEGVIEILRPTLKAAGINNDPVKGMMNRIVSNQRAIVLYRIYNKYGLKSERTLVFLDELAESFLPSDHKYVKEDKRALSNDYIRLRYGKAVEDDIQILLANNVIGCDYKMKFGKAGSKAYCYYLKLPEIIETYTQPVNKEALTIISCGKKRSRETTKESILNSKKGKIEKFWDKQISFGYINLVDVCIYLLEGFSDINRTEKQQISLIQDLDIVVNIAFDHFVSIDKKGVLKYRKEHYLPENCSRPFCSSRDYNLTNKLKGIAFNLPGKTVSNYDLKACHLQIFHDHFAITESLDDYLNTDGHKENMADQIGVDLRTLKNLMISLTYGAGCNTVFGAKSEIEEQLEVYHNFDYAKVQNSLKVFKDQTRAFRADLASYHRDIIDDIAKHQTNAMRHTITSTSVPTLLSHQLVGIEQRIIQWWVLEQKRLDIKVICNMFDGFICIGKIEDKAALKFGALYYQGRLVEKPFD